MERRKSILTEIWDRKRPKTLPAALRNESIQLDDDAPTSYEYLIDEYKYDNRSLYSYLQLESTNLFSEKYMNLPLLKLNVREQPNLLKTQHLCKNTVVSVAVMMEAASQPDTLFSLEPEQWNVTVKGESVILQDNTFMLTSPSIVNNTRKCFLMKSTEDRNNVRRMKREAIDLFTYNDAMCAFVIVLFDTDEQKKIHISEVISLTRKAWRQEIPRNNTLEQNLSNLNQYVSKAPFLPFTNGLNKILKNLTAAEISEDISSYVSLVVDDQNLMTGIYTTQVINKLQLLHLEGMELQRFDSLESDLDKFAKQNSQINSSVGSRMQLCTPPAYVGNECTKIRYLRKQNPFINGFDGKFDIRIETEYLKESKYMKYLKAADEDSEISDLRAESTYIKILRETIPYVPSNNPSVIYIQSRSRSVDITQETMYSYLKRLKKSKVTKMLIITTLDVSRSLTNSVVVLYKCVPPFMKLDNIVDRATINTIRSLINQNFPEYLVNRYENELIEGLQSMGLSMLNYRVPAGNFLII